ncbi:hypothetical protein BDR26DRAFT_814266 [Obelidium mucronatum]|nr:hypothetical protein BDR26DRAFT_814266 [Obelidium mucronatum]
MLCKIIRFLAYKLLTLWPLYRSIHKSQGQTLPLLRVNLGKVFEKGQSYVALSRAVSLEGLQVLNFRREKVAAHSKVIQFNRELLTL